MHLGSIYLIARDFHKSITFYEKLLDRPVTAQNMERFAMFMHNEQCLAIMNAYFDTRNPGKTIYKGTYTPAFDELPAIAETENTRKIVLNFCCEDLTAEHQRITGLDLSENLTSIKYVYNVAPYYYFQLDDPDGNVIEVTGAYAGSINS